MSNPSATLQETEVTLQSVIEVLIDGQKGFHKIAENVKDPDLKLFFLEESLKRAEFRGKLETILHQEGVHDIEESGSATAGLQRAWGGLKARLGGGDQSLVATAEQDEHAAAKAYSEALCKELPFPVRQLLASQATHIRLFHGFVLELRNGGE